MSNNVTQSMSRFAIQSMNNSAQQCKSSNAAQSMKKYVTQFKNRSVRLST